MNLDSTLSNCIAHCEPENLVSRRVTDYNVSLISEVFLARGHTFFKECVCLVGDLSGQLMFGYLP